MRSAVKQELIGLKRHLRAEVCDGHGAYLFSERGVTVLRGRGIEPIIALLDGTRSMADLLYAMPHGVDPEQAAGLIRQLMAAGLVTVGPSRELGMDERALAYWDACGVAVERRRTSAVDVVSVASAITADTVVSALDAAGLAVTSRPALASGSARPTGELTVVVCDDYLDPALSEIDRAHREAGVPWLLAKPVGTQVWVGPVFQSGHGCWHCLAHCLWRHRDAEACAQAALGRRGPASRPAVAIPALLSTGLNLIALEATKWLAGLRYSGQHCVWTLDTVDLSGSRHELRQRPQCSHCGDPSLIADMAHRPVVLRPTEKSSYGGGHRSLPPEEVLVRYQHLVSPVTGIIKEITRDNRCPSLFNSYRSGANAAARHGDMAGFRRGLREQSGGKGATAIEAEVGALCEAVERYSATFHGDEARERGSYRALGERAIHPNDVLLIHERQYADRERWNRAHGRFHAVGQPFDEHEEIDWTPVWSLRQRRHRLLPTAMLYFGTPSEFGGGRLCSDSNGNAAGSELADAVLQGLLELVERDAVALWWYNRIAAPAVDLDAFGDDWLAWVRAEYRGLGRELWVLDVTSDLDIPVMVAVSRSLTAPRERIMFGFGAHLDPRIALRRAVTELNQFAPAFLADEADGADEPAVLDDPDAAWWFREATLANQPYLAGDPSFAARTPADYPDQRRDDIRQEVNLITTRLATLGMDTLVLDQTRPDIGMPVVKVIVPGMRHFWARFGPGRLYDVPVMLGRLERPTSYAELNPIPIFL
ncbi:TOMM precursor leader peptide-binding protein [Haloechinothrix halophila]|uniref:TOMM precursor leader peptide-binding protein n=1 Tax=Haloechinothrix halophila TaxID=1069073 RepID=UPI00054D45E6|nr:TOMM precursor leader peptide-binding protein [Haloechinothrix halophila]